MTFIPSVLTKIDDNNTTNATSSIGIYIGTGTLTTGYNSVIVTLSSTVNSNAGGLQIQYSSDNSTFTTYYNDTYFTGTNFTKTYNLINKYYRIVYTPSSSATFTITSRLNVDESPEQSNINNIYSLPQDGMYDAFGKLRVTNPYTLLDIKFPSASTGTADYLSNSMLECNGATGTGTATYGSSKCVMTANGGTGTFISQSRKYCIYQPGKSLLFLGSGIIGPTGITSTNYTNRLGYFDDENGLFFEYGSTGATGTMSAVLRNTPAGTTVAADTFIPQSNWNIDKLDGTGNSGITLDFTKAQLFVIDFEWLSVGRIRYGFYIYGKIFYCHQITNVNSLTAPYMLTPNLPIRYEVRNNDTDNTHSVSLTQICSSVITEGGYNPVGRPFSANVGSVGVTVSTEIAVFALSGYTGTSSPTTNQYKHQQIIPSTLNILADTSKNVLYNIYLFQAPNGPTGSFLWNIPNSNSVAQYSTPNVAINNLSSAILVDNGYIQGNGNVLFDTLQDIFNNIVQITSNITNISDTLVVTAQAVGGGGGSTTVWTSMTWTESY